MKKKEENIVYKYNNYQDLRLGNIEGSIKVINGEMGGIQKDIKGVEIKITRIENDIGWLKQHFWIIVNASVLALIASILNLLF